MNELKQVSIRMVKEKSIKYDESITTPKQAVEIMKDFLGDFDREAFVVVCLDNQNKPTNFTIAHIGAVNKSIVHPREVFKTAILSNASSVMCFHNHPGGSLKPSQEDITVTNCLRDAGEILAIKLLDHIIIAGDRAYSIVGDMEVKS